MPSKNKSAVSSATPSQAAAHHAFLPLLVVTFIIWVIYRSLFQFDVWFDESIGKALFFGLPVWLYIHLSGSHAIPSTFSLNKLHTGLLSGLAVGGIFGFAASLLSIWQAGGVQAVAIFSSPLFWGEFMLAMMTAFWESLFFFSWIMIVLQEKFPKWSLGRLVVSVALIFLVFHIPNILLRTDGMVSLNQAVLLFLFALGQALFFYNRRNGYALVLSHAIWGMVLLVHFSRF